MKYSAEVRAEIGKYAVQHGNIAAIRHFAEQTGQTIPESTIREMKDKYLGKLMQINTNFQVEN